MNRTCNQVTSLSTLKQSGHVGSLVEGNNESSTGSIIHTSIHQMCIAGLLLKLASSTPGLTTPKGTLVVCSRTHGCQLHRDRSETAADDTD